MHHARIAVVLVVTLLVAACETVPITGRSQVILFSEKEMSELADKHHVQFMTEARQKGTVVGTGTPNDARDVAMVDRVGRRIIDAAGRSSFTRNELAYAKKAYAFVGPIRLRAKSAMNTRMQRMMPIGPIA